MLFAKKPRPLTNYTIPFTLSKECSEELAQLREHSKKIYLDLLLSTRQAEDGAIAYCDNVAKMASANRSPSAAEGDEKSTVQIKQSCKKGVLLEYKPVFEDLVMSVKNCYALCDQKGGSQRLCKCMCRRAFLIHNNAIGAYYTKCMLCFRSLF